MNAEQKPSKNSFARFVRDLLVIVVAALAISFVLKTFLLRSFYIPSGSMQNTLQINDRVMVNQLVPDIAEVKRGDIIVFKDPGGWLTGTVKPETTWLQDALEFIGLAPDSSNDYLIKRVIGVGGDHVTCCSASGKLTINGIEITEPYTLLPAGHEAASALEFEVTVPEGSLWVMGDNRYQSSDSRYNQDLPSKGFVPLENVVGRAFLVNWPFERFGVLSRHAEVFDEVPATQDKQ